MFSGKYIRSNTHSEALNLMVYFYYEHDHLGNTNYWITVKLVVGYSQTEKKRQLIFPAFIASGWCYCCP